MLEVIYVFAVYGTNEDGSQRTGLHAVALADDTAQALKKRLQGHVEIEKRRAVIRRTHSGGEVLEVFLLDKEAQFPIHAGETISNARARRVEEIKRKLPEEEFEFLAGELRLGR